MSKTNRSIFVGIIVLIILLLSGSGFFGGWGLGGWGMMGPGMMGGWGFSPFAWIGMIFMGLIPVSFIALTVLGIAWLRQTRGDVTSPPSERACPNCSHGAQADWMNCPYCGTSLK